MLQSQEPAAQAAEAVALSNKLTKLVNASHATGPFFLGPRPSWVDVQLAPWLLRLSRVLTPYRGWPAPERGSRWAAWIDAVEAEPAVQATTSDDNLYLDSYQRYAGMLKPSRALVSMCVVCVLTVIQKIVQIRRCWRTL